MTLPRQLAHCQIYRRVLACTCLFLLLGILYFGLKPFRAPENQVEWVPNGLRFGEHGTILSSGSFSRMGSAEGAQSLEFWVQPTLVEDSSTLIAFYDPANRRQISFLQAESDLEIRTGPSAAWHTGKSERINIGEAFRHRANTLWGITFGPSGTAIYRNGSLVGNVPLMSGRQLSGRLVVGNSPIFNDSWAGIFHGLAIYNTALDAGQIARHYSSWSKGTAPHLDSTDHCVALYLFNEGGGKIVHNRVRSENDLFIPRKYLVIRQTVLDPIWRAFNWSVGFWKDAIINVAGFVPFGCFFCAYFSVLEFRRPQLRAIAFGGLVSLVIELTQTQLPTRDSSMADLINNILGTALGALAYRGMVARAIDSGLCLIVSIVGGYRRPQAAHFDNAGEED